MTWRLDPRCELAVLAASEEGAEHEDLGCGLQGPASHAVRRALDPLRRRIRALGLPAALARAQELTRWVERQPEYAALCSSKTSGGRRLLKSSVLYGGARHLKPRLLQIRLSTAAVQFPVRDWPGAHDLLTLALHGAPLLRIQTAALQSRQSELVETLLSAGWLTEAPDDVAPADARREKLWFVGHNTVVVSSKTTRVLIDPWFRPWRDADPPTYRPLRPVDVGPVDAIAITHSHGDHFHLGSLLAFPRETRIFVPRVPRESILATDLERRLREIGFTRVQAIGWWESARIGDVRIHAMPFYGEQPSPIAVVDPELRNMGNTWIVDTGDLKAAFLADTGRDAAGTMQQAALEARRRWGGADIVFGGMRGFAMSPIMLPFTTLDAMFVNVPLELMPVRQRLMNDADDLLSVAEILGATDAVPYADGGSPWYFREGMGPAYEGYPSYPGERTAPRQSEEDPDSAPFPERLDAAVEARWKGPPAVRSLLLRPGDLVRWSRKAPRVGRVEGHAWPYGA